MDNHPTGDDIAAVAIYAIGAIVIAMLMWQPSILDYIANAIIEYVRAHQTA